MIALTPATRVLLQLSYSLVEVALISLMFTFEQKSIPHQQTQIWAFRSQCQRRCVLISLALQIEATSVLVQQLHHLTNKLIKMPYMRALRVLGMILATRC